MAAALKDAASDKIRNVSNKVKGVGKLVARPFVKLKDGATSLIKGVTNKVKSVGKLVAHATVKLKDGVTAGLFYINGSDISHVFDDTPEAITAWICSQLGVPFGTAAPTGVKVYMPCLGKKAYEAIMAAYTAASRQNGKKYILMMQDVSKVCVIEKGALCGAVLEGGYNLTEAAYKTSLQNMVNRVVITNKEGGQVGVVEDADARKKYGTLQRVYQQQDGKNDTAEAKALLQAIEQSGSVTATSDVRAISGYAIIVQEPVTGLYGKFYIESDTHTFSDGKEEMQLTLAFSNMMDEKEIDKETKA